MAAHLLVKTEVWLEHALEEITEDNKKLEQTKDLEKRMFDTEARAKRVEEEASEAKRLRAESDRFQKGAETALVIERSAREALEKKHVEDMQRVKAEKKRLVEQVHQLDQDLLKVEVHTFTLGYNDCVLVAKEKGLVYKALFFNSEVDITLEVKGNLEGNQGKTINVETPRAENGTEVNPDTPMRNPDGSDGQSPLV